MKKILTLIILVLSCAKVVRNFGIKNKNIDESLVLAIKKGDTYEAIYLIKKGANINYLSENKTILELALDYKNLSIVKELIERSVNLSKINIISIYNLALEYSKYSIIELIKNNYKLEERLIDKTKYFLLLCYTSNAEEVKKFIKKSSINPKDIKDKINRNALNIACIGRKIDIAYLLIEEYQIDINHKDRFGNTSLILASKNDYIELVKLLVEKKASINEKNINGYTALIMACEKNHLEVAKLLLEKGANVNDKKENGYTSLMIASQKGYPEVVKLLLVKGVDIDYRNTILSIKSQNVETIKLLMKKGCYFNNENSDDNKVLMIVYEDKHFEYVNLLSGNDVNIDEMDEVIQIGGSQSSLTIAYKNDHIDIVKLLIEKGAYIGWIDIALEGILIENIKVNNIENSLLIACKYKNRIDFGYKDKEGNTLLHYAALSNNLDLFNEIFSEYVDLNSLNNRGESPLYYALLSNNINQDFVMYLIEKGASLKPSSYIKGKLLIDILSPYEYLSNKFVYEPLTFKLLDNINLNFEDKNKIKEIIKILKIKEDDFNNKDKELMINFIQDMFNIKCNDSLDVCNISTLIVKDDNKDVDLNVDVFMTVLSNFTKDDFEESIRNEGIDNIRARFFSRLNDVKSSIPQLNKPIKPSDTSNFELANYEENMKKYNLGCIKFTTKKQLYKLGLLISQASEKDKSNIKWAINVVLEHLVCPVGTLEAINYAIRCLIQQDDNNDLKDALSNEIAQFRIDLIEEVARNHLHNKIMCTSELGRAKAEYSNHMLAYLVMDLASDLKVTGLYENEFKYEYNKIFVINEVNRLYKERLVQEVVALIRNGAKLSNMVRDYLEKNIFKTNNYLMIEDFIHDDEYKIKEGVIKSLLVHFGYLK